MEKQSHEIAKQIRQDFFVYRNGLLADALRASGDKHKMIFGLNLPQIVAIAKKFEPNVAVATELWNSTETRECRLIAPMLFPIEDFDKATALDWIKQIKNIETADNFCHKLLRNTPFASDLCIELSQGTDMQRYIAMRLAINLITIGEQIDFGKMLAVAQSELTLANSTNISVAKSLIADIEDFLQ